MSPNVKVHAWRFTLHLTFLKTIRVKKKQKTKKQISCHRPSGHHLCRWAAGAEHCVDVLDEELSEDVDRGQSGQGDGAVTRPDQVHAKNTRQVRWRHLVYDAFLRHLKGAPHRRERGNREKTSTNWKGAAAFSLTCWWQWCLTVRVKSPIHKQVRQIKWCFCIFKMIFIVTYFHIRRRCCLSRFICDVTSM